MDNFSVPSGSLPPIPPTVGNNNMPVAPPVIQQAPPPVTPPQTPTPAPTTAPTQAPLPTPTTTTTVSSGSSVPVAKILLAVIPFFAFVVTGAISYTLMNQKAPVKYLSRASELSPSAAQIVEASKSGCVFSLRFDKDGMSDVTLKQEALDEMNKIKTRLTSGEKADDVIFQILNGETKTAHQKRLTDYLQTKKFIPLTNPLAKFNPESTPNFCYENSAARDQRLGQFFYDNNSAFKQNLVTKEISDPFLIYQSSDSTKIESGWMLIQK
jgi:hypothetical protein